MDRKSGESRRFAKQRFHPAADAGVINNEVYIRIFEAIFKQDVIGTGLARAAFRRNCRARLGLGHDGSGESLNLRGGEQVRDEEITVFAVELMFFFRQCS